MVKCRKTAGVVCQDWDKDATCSSNSQTRLQVIPHVTVHIHAAITNAQGPTADILGSHNENPRKSNKRTGKTAIPHSTAVRTWDSFNDLLKLHFIPFAISMVTEAFD